MAFEELDPRTMLPKDRSVITMRKNGAIALSRGVVLRSFSGKPYAQLFFDAEGGRIAVKPCAKGTPHACALQHTKAGAPSTRRAF